MFPCRIFIIEVLHEGGVILEVLKHLFHTELIVLVDVDVVDLALLHQLLSFHKNLAQSILVSLVLRF